VDLQGQTVAYAEDNQTAQVIVAENPMVRWRALPSIEACWQATLNREVDYGMLSNLAYLHQQRGEGGHSVEIKLALSTPRQRAFITRADLPALGQYLEERLQRLELADHERLLTNWTQFAPVVDHRQRQLLRWLLVGLAAILVGGLLLLGWNRLRIIGWRKRRRRRPRSTRPTTSG
jgi:hypothetical protein